MNIQVKHNGDFISDYVISYEREHKICTAVGTLTLVVSDNIATTFNPWDEIDIYEEGDFKVRYYVSSINWSVPNSTITLDCQDESKRLVDYFIPDQYTVEYPTYTRFWIEKFLDEVGTSYNFETSSQGNLLSNFTSLGLMSAYEQIIVLLQLSGWYMYFDGNGVAQIGKLNTNLSDYSDSLQKTDILDINVKKDDRMLRNRALVWGNYNPISLTRIFADVQVHTPWNYDHDDIRTMVIANSNIPNNSSAYGIANLLVKEFARITVEKHITATGARDIQLGDVIKVYSNVYTGSGLVTTFGVSMGKDGLITNLILDERCPRLFGYFNFGDYVYVGTYGDGVWRKHLKFIHNWENFSTGLDDLRVTDLHINNGIFSSVTSSGGMFYKVFDDVPWGQIQNPEFLLSSQYDNLDDAPGSGFFEIPFSGINARATMVDKNLNRIIYGVDTYSGENMGDYYMMYSSFMGSGIFGSGLVASATDERGWVLAYNLGQGISTYDSYPISVSGEYNIRVIDIENDGKDDYVSVAVLSPGSITHTSLGYNFGSQTFQPVTEVGDTNAIVSIAVEQFNLEGQSLSGTVTTATNKTISVFDNESIGEKDIVWHESGGGLSRFIRKHFFKEFDIDLGRDIVTFTNTISASQVGTGLGTVQCISKISVGTYKIFHSSFTGGTLDTDYSFTMKVRIWDSLLNTVTADTTLGTLTVAQDPNKPMAITSEFFQTDTLTVSGIIYHYVLHFGSTNGGTGSAPNTENYVSISRMIVDTSSDSTIAGHLATVDFEESEGFPGQTWTTFSLTGALPIPKFLFQNGSSIAIAFIMREWNNLSASSATILRNWLISSEDGSAFEKTQIQTTTTDSDTNFLLSSGTNESNSGAAQLTTNNHLLYHRKSSTGVTYLFNGDTVVITSFVSDAPYYWKPSKIYPLFGAYSNFYLVKDSGTWYYANSLTLIPNNVITFPSNYTVIAPYLTTDSVTPQYYWLATNNDTFEEEILVTSNSAVLRTIAPFEVVGSSFLDRGYVIGNFFINYKPGTGAARFIYLDNDSNVPGAGTRFLVLQREGEDFNIVQEAAFPIRIDISLFSPLLTLQHKESTFNSFSIYDNEVFQTAINPTFSGLLADVPDYRYTMIPGSGELGISKQAVYIIESGIWAFDALTFSGIRLAYNNVAESGWLGRIETSNFVGSGQYLFVTTSGDFPQFYQKDPELEYFTLYSGLPDSRATIIRLDDRI